MFSKTCIGCYINTVRKYLAPCRRYNQKQKWASSPRVQCPVSALPTRSELVFSSLMANGSNRQGRLNDPIQKWKMVWQFWSWKALGAAGHTAQGAVPTGSGWAIQAQSGELSLTSPCTGHCTEPSFEQNPLHGTCSPWEVQLCHQGLHFTAFSSAVLHHHPLWNTCGHIHWGERWPGRV